MQDFYGLIVLDLIIKHFQVLLVGNKDEKVIEVLMQRVKKKAKRNFTSYGQFVETKDNFSNK